MNATNSKGGWWAATVEYLQTQEIDSSFIMGNYTKCVE